ncbi:hypothetical protein FRB95_002695 [Tulasnella sp. JGI-2019a]|nr:hypothetical protein FRB95_002695 [Tulasnella sp. JGI-2019a]
MTTLLDCPARSMVVPTTIKRRHRAKKQAEEKYFLSAEFRVADLDNDEQFYAKERELRNRSQKAPETGTLP